MGITSKLVKRIAEEIAPEVGRLVDAYVAKAVTDDPKVKLLIRSEVQNYLEFTRNSVEQLSKVNNDLLDRFMKLLDDYDGVQSQVRKLSERVDRLEASLERKESRQLEAPKPTASEPPP